VACVQREWLSGKIIEKLGNTDYSIISDEGAVVHRHVDKIKLKSKVDALKQSVTTSIDNTNVPTFEYIIICTRNTRKAGLFPGGVSW
jgi:hypothetical protein